jgi:hypothetical protein
MNQKSLWGLGGLGLVAIAAVVALRSSSSSGDVRRSEAPSLLKRDESRLDCSYQVGQRMAWAMSTRSSLVVPGQDRPMDGPRFSARLTLEPLRNASTTEPGVMLGRFTEVDVETTQAQGRAFSNGFLLKLSANCEILAYARDPSTPDPTARAQQVTLSELWFKVPDQNGAEATGRDGTGVFKAQLYSDSTDGVRIVQRKVLSYSRVWGREQSLPTVDDSFMNVTLASNGWFKSVSSVVSRSSLFGTARFEVELVPTPVEATSLETLSRDEKAYVWVDLLPMTLIPATAEAPAFTELERRQQAALRELTLERAVAVFLARLNEPRSSAQDQWPVMARYLEARPEAIPAYAELLTSGGFSSDQLGTAFLALGKAKVPEARSALMQIRADEQVRPLNRHRAALALAERGDVGLELARQLRADSAPLVSGDEVERFLARNSLLALGMLIGTGTRPPAVQDEARAAIREALARGTTALDLRPAFGAMGNTGDVAWLAELETYSHHADPDVRAVAAHGFRRLEPEQSEAFVVGWLSRETSPDVKRELFHVIHHQHLDAQRNVSASIARLAAVHLREQPLLLTRQSIVRVLGPLASTNVEAKAALLDQVPRELNFSTGMYNLISMYVDGDDVSRALQRAQPEFDLATATPPPDSAPDVPPRPELDRTTGFDSVSP